MEQNNKEWWQIIASPEFKACMDAWKRQRQAESAERGRQIIRDLAAFRLPKPEESGDE